MSDGPPEGPEGPENERLGKASTLPPAGDRRLCPECAASNDPSELLCTACGVDLDDGGARALIGTVVLSVYEIQAVLGQGGMSVVYRGCHRLTEQMVALKIMPPELAANAGLKARFLEEAKALARLEHPNIVRLYNFGEEGGRFVLAMQYVEGETFEHRIIRAGRLAWDEATRITCEILRALEYAHDRGIVHRDMKPSNIIVRPDGSAMVMDFGIAKITRDSSRLTAVGQTMGTVRYMSPEQVRGQSVDLRSDLYSVGATLFEALTGDTPFDGAAHFDIMMKHLSEAPPTARERGAELPAELDAILQRALAKSPDDRQQTAAELRLALEEVLRQAPASVPAPGPPPSRPARAALPPTEATPVSAAAVNTAPVMRAPRRRGGRAVVAAALVVAAAGGALVLMRLRQGSGAAAPDAQPAAPTWPEPVALPGVAFEVDVRLEPERLHIRAMRASDARRLAGLVNVAAGRFAGYLAGRKLPGAEAGHALNLLLVDGGVMCDRRVFAPKPAPEDCSVLRFHYRREEATLFVLDSPDLEAINLPEAIAAHLCRVTPALSDQGCYKNLLPPYWDEIEKKK